MNHETIARRKEKAAQEYSVKQSFIGRNTRLFYMVCGVYLIAAGWSAVTAGGNIYIRLETAMGTGALPFTLAALLALAIVTLQYVTGKGMVDDLQVNAYKGTLSEKSMLYLKASAFLVVTTFSVMLSVNGAKIANQWYRETRNTATLLDENAAVAQFDARILAAESRIKDLSQVKWKNTITVDARRMIASEQRNIQSLQTQRAVEVERIRDINQANLTQHTIQTDQNGFFLAHLAGVGELVCLFCILFIGIYDDGIYREAGVKNKRSAKIRIHKEVEDIPFEEVQDRIHVSGFASAKRKDEILSKLQTKRRVQLHRIRKAGTQATQRQWQGLRNTEAQIKQYKNQA